MDIKTLVILLIALCPTAVEIFHNFYVMFKQTKMFDNITSMYDLTKIKNKMDKQLIENQKLQNSIKTTFKILYKQVYNVELSDEDVESIINKNSQG